LIVPALELAVPTAFETVKVKILFDVLRFAVWINSAEEKPASGTRGTRRNVPEPRDVEFSAVNVPRLVPRIVWVLDALVRAWTSAVGAATPALSKLRGSRNSN
jgi:hypothetical protein